MNLTIKFITLLCCVSFTNAKIHVTHEITPQTHSIGSEISLIINVDIDSLEYLVHFPSEFLPNKQYEIKLNEVNKTNSQYKIQCWETGDIYLPKINIKVQDSQNETKNISLDSIYIKVSSTIDVNAREIRDIKALKIVEVNMFQRVLVISFGIFALISILYILKKRKNKNPYVYKNTSIKSISTYKSIKSSLENLEIDLPINHQHSETFFLELSKLFKQFLESEYFITSTQMTSSEIKTYLNSLKLKNDLLENIINLIERADSIKYAKQLPQIDEINASKTELINFITILHNKSQQNN